jgi:dipeptidyl aminopeptidase/acylaminoacyl peptidase
MLVALTLAASLATAAAATAAPLTFAAARALVTPSDPQLSPDGSRLAYVRTTGDYKNDRKESELILVDVASGAARPLTRDRIGVAAPAWSPSGDRIAYLAEPERGKPTQLYVLRMDGGDSQKVTDAPNGVSAFAWQPDGKAFAYVTEDDAPNKKAIEHHDDGFFVTDEHYLTRAKALPSHLWTIGTDGTGAKRRTSGPWTIVGKPAFSPDGTSVIFGRWPDPIFAHLVSEYTAVLNLATGTVKPLLSTSPDTMAAFAHDGTLVADVAPRHGSVYLSNDLAIHTLDGTVRGTSMAIDRNVNWFAWMPGDAQIALGTSDGVRHVLWLLTVGGGGTKVDLGDVEFDHGGSVANDGAIAFVGSTPDRPSEVYVVKPGSAPKALTANNAAFAAYRYGKVENIEWPVDGGFTADGVLTYPPGYTPGKKLPLVLVIHGGPVSSTTIGFDAFAQILAGRGYLVFQPNYRGSDNLGDAYLQAIVGHVTSGPGRDNLAGVEALKARGIVDETKMAVSGWSGGGLQTSWIIGHTHEFKAAVSGAAVNDWYEQAVLADINEPFAQAFIPGVSPFTKAGRAVYDAESPITYFRNITTPVLILSDTGDQRVPITQSFALYHALKETHKTVTFIEFPRAGHFPSDPVGREMAEKTWAAWFDRWLK